MRSNKMEVRGCCFGIPIGCGSLMLLLIGGVVSQTLTGGFSASVAVKLLAALVSVCFIGASILLMLGWREEKRCLPLSA